MGQIKVRDTNEDGRINEKDKIILGSDMPTISAGMINNFNYKNFHLNFSFFGSFGHMIYNNILDCNLYGRSNTLDVDYWTPENPTNDHPQPDGSIQHPLYGSSRGYVSGDFLKVRNIQFGYNIPKSILGNIGIQSMEVYVNLEDPFIFSKLAPYGLDPEKYGGRVSYGGGSPDERMYLFGINVKF